MASQRTLHLCRSIRTATVVALGMAVVLAGATMSRAQPEPTTRSGLRLTARAVLDDERQSALRVTTDVPYRNLVFFKENGRFEAEYDVFLTIFKNGKEKAPDESLVFRNRVIAESYEETRRPENRSTATRTFRMPAGSYRVVASLSVRRTQLRSQREQNVSVPDFMSTGIGFSTPVVTALPTDRGGALRRWSDEVELDPYRVELAHTMFDHQPAVRFSVYLSDDANLPVDGQLYYELLGPDRHQHFYGRQAVVLDDTEVSFILPVTVADLEPGTYDVRIRVVSSDPAREASTQTTIGVTVSQAMLTSYFDETMDILGLIADRSELEPLRNAAEEDRFEEWYQFWKKRDPDPATERNEALEEHLRRVRYADKAFGRGTAGWRTDRGRVYVQYGPPERVDTVTDYRSQGEYEIWRYFTANRRFIFYDMFGLGDFKLVEGGFY